GGGGEGGGGERGGGGGRRGEEGAEGGVAGGGDAGGSGANPIALDGVAGCAVAPDEHAEGARSNDIAVSGAGAADRVVLRALFDPDTVAVAPCGDTVGGEADQIALYGVVICAVDVHAGVAAG